MTAAFAALGIATLIAGIHGLTSGLWLHLIREDLRRTRRSRA